MANIPIYTPSQEQVKKYKYRLIIPLEAPERDKTIFFTALGTVLAIGYIRIVIGERGPYIEFNEHHLSPLEQFFQIPQQAIRLSVLFS